MRRAVADEEHACVAQARGRLVEKRAHPLRRVDVGLAAWVRHIDVLQGLPQHLRHRMACELAVVELAQPRVRRHLNAASLEDDRRRLRRAHEVGANYGVELLGAHLLAPLGRLLTAEVGQRRVVMPRGEARNVVLASLVRAEDDA